MHQIIVGMVVLFTMGIVLCTSIMLYMWKTAKRELRKYSRNPNNIQSVSVHTYKPSNSVVPMRGWLVIERGIKLARIWKTPLILSVGKTVVGEQRTESEIYRDEAIIKFGTDVQIITARDRSVRETSGEVKQTLKEARMLGSRHHVAIGLAPHIARIRLIWQEAKPEYKQPELLLLPVSGPLRYWLWEALMLCVHVVAPPGSKRQSLLLNIVGRKG